MRLRRQSESKHSAQQAESAVHSAQCTGLSAASPEPAGGRQARCELAIRGTPLGARAARAQLATPSLEATSERRTTEAWTWRHRGRGWWMDDDADQRQVIILGGAVAQVVLPF